MKKALVTGGCGFIGSHIVDRLCEKGILVNVVDDLSATENESFFYNSKALYHEVNILDKDKLERVFDYFKPDVVFHLAAKARIQRSIENPQNTCEVNFSGTCNILEFSRKYNVDRVLFSSTSSVYGLKNQCPLREDMPKDCLNPYSISKSAAEELCKMYYGLYKLKVITFRYFNVFGERQPIKGEYAPVIGLFFKQKLSGKEMTIVGDGLQTRDFTYIEDVVNANLLAAETRNEKAFGQIFNVGSGKSNSVLEISKMIDGNISFLPERKGEAQNTLADISKIENLLGYRSVTNLENWIKKEKDKLFY